MTFFLIFKSSSALFSLPTSAKDLTPCAKSFLLYLIVNKSLPSPVFFESVSYEKPYSLAKDFINLPSILPENKSSLTKQAEIISTEKIVILKRILSGLHFLRFLRIIFLFLV
jgi:hypothetical protein